MTKKEFIQQMAIKNLDVMTISPEVFNGVFVPNMIWLIEALEENFATNDYPATARYKDLPKTFFEPKEVAVWNQ